MRSAADMPEERIRERAYYMWEASGRPSGRDEEFWHQACQAIATDGERIGPGAQQRRTTRGQSPRKRTRTKG
jgi:Protein of unknown function (DUF2934)